MNWMGGAKYDTESKLFRRARMKKYLQDKKKKQHLNVTGSITKRSATVINSDIVPTKSFPITKKRKVVDTSSVDKCISS